MTNSISRVITGEERMIELIKDGFGSGRGERYQPWIGVTRMVSSPLSHVNVHATPVQSRGIHLLSKLERTASYVACWLGATEIREQFPLFPWRGIHPMAGLERTRDLAPNAAPALKEIADEIGVDLGWYLVRPARVFTMFFAPESCSGSPALRGLPVLSLAAASPARRAVVPAAAVWQRHCLPG